MGLMWPGRPTAVAHSDFDSAVVKCPRHLNIRPWQWPRVPDRVAEQFANHQNSVTDRAIHDSGS